MRVSHHFFFASLRLLFAPLRENRSSPSESFLNNSEIAATHLRQIIPRFSIKIIAYPEAAP